MLYVYQDIKKNIHKLNDETADPTFKLIGYLVRGRFISTTTELNFRRDRELLSDKILTPDYWEINEPRSNLPVLE